MLQKGQTHPDVYQKIKWMVNTKLQNPCAQRLRSWNSEYNVCMKVILPRAMAGHFTLIGDRLQKNADSITFKKEDRTNKITSYIAACQADSGSGHWVTIHDDKSSIYQNQKDDNTRRALVAVLTRTVDASFKLPNGKLVKGVCGGVVKNPSGKKKAFTPYAIKTTHKEVLKFIKKWLIVRLSSITM